MRVSDGKWDIRTCNYGNINSFICNTANDYIFNYIDDFIIVEGQYWGLTYDICNIEFDITLASIPSYLSELSDLEHIWIGLNSSEFNNIYIIG